VLGNDGFTALTGMVHIDNPPNNEGGHMGSAYQTGWYGYVRRDLRAILGVAGRHRYSRRYCGRGNRARCAKVLRDSLAAALKVPRTEVYKDDRCSDGDQKCFDAIEHRALGAVSQPLIDWVNRPTFQQVVEIPRRRS
jgi:hypothetical protein